MKAQKTKTRRHRPRSVAAEKAGVTDLSTSLPPSLPKGRGEEKGMKAKAEVY